MSRTIKTVVRPDVHPYAEDTDAPGTCGQARCHLPKRNSVHDTAAAAAALPDMSAEMADHRRRAGDRDGD